MVLNLASSRTDKLWLSSRHVLVFQNVYIEHFIGFPWHYVCLNPKCNARVLCSDFHAPGRNLFHIIVLFSFKAGACSYEWSLSNFQFQLFFSYIIKS